ncbi:MAG: VOC family protein [Chloroflexota bacterium]
MPKYWLDHVHLYSEDPLATAKLYESMFGARIYNTRGEAEGKAHTTVQLSLRGTGIYISGQETRPASALQHYGIRTDDIEAAVAELKAKGAKFERDIALHEVTGSRVARLIVPDGLVVELIQPSRPRPDQPEA